MPFATAWKRCELLLRAALLAAAAVGVSRSALAQSCSMYFTDFPSLVAPPDLVEGSFRVAWCASGTTVVSSSFCNNGNALKLDSATDDPVILIATGASGCTAIEISFDYAQFAATQTVVRYGTTTATAVSCSAATPSTLGALTATGGVCTPFTATIQLNGAPGVCLRLDHGANANAITIDNLEIRRVGCCTTGGHGCCTTGSPGCTDSAVAACVCGADPFCCQTQWDAQCVTEVVQLGCGSCSGGQPCIDVLELDFGTLYSAGSICSKYPTIFEWCEGTAPFLTSSLGCAGVGDAAMRFASGFPYSAAVTRCINFAQRATPALSFTYSKTSGTLGPRVDYSLDGITWASAWTAPVAFAGGCAPVEIDLSPLAGMGSVRFRFSSGSSVSNLAVFDDILLREVTSTAHACCAEGGPSCDNPVTSSCTCGLDAYCCDVAWDELCVVIATMYCDADCPDLPVCGSPTAGSCTAPHATAACADAECCVAVCTVDAYCCDTAWDEVCAAEATAGCFVPADINRDGRVSSIDLAMVLDQWGTAGGSADVDGNGSVGATDLSAVLAAWTG